MTYPADHRLRSARVMERFIRTLLWCWPGSTRSLVLSLRAASLMLTAVLLLGLWRATAVMSWLADSVIATAACLLFAYFFERNDADDADRSARQPSNAN